MSLRTLCEKVTVHDTDDRLRLLSQAAGDLREAGNIRTLEEAQAAAFSVETVLAPTEA